MEARGWASLMDANVSGTAAWIGRTAEAPPNEHGVAPVGGGGTTEVAGGSSIAACVLKHRAERERGRHWSNRFQTDGGDSGGRIEHPCHPARLGDLWEEVGVGDDGGRKPNRRSEARAAARRGVCTNGDRCVRPCRWVPSGADNRDAITRL